MEKNLHRWQEKAEVLIESLPFMRKYSNNSIVIKFGGHAMTKNHYINSFASDMTLLRQVGIRPIIVHGGGPQIEKMLKKLEIKSEFFNGLRVTDSDTISIVEMVLSGQINKSLVSEINQVGGKAVGISGKDGNLIRATKYKVKSSEKDNLIDLGFVGIPTKIDPEVINSLMLNNMMPVIAPLALGEDGLTYNINADVAAGSISSAIKAKRLLMLTDVSGVLDKSGKLISNIDVKYAEKLIADRIVNGGMIPKLETCIKSVKNGTEAAVILDGRLSHSTLIELFTEKGVGTLISKD
tara:strand:+ start:25 stop:909 length:885 start_codon:yes stop_codon:yes gene_type:complete